MVKIVLNDWPVGMLWGIKAYLLSCRELDEKVNRNNEMEAAGLVCHGGEENLHTSTSKAHQSMGNGIDGISCIFICASQFKNDTDEARLAVFPISGCCAKLSQYMYCTCYRQEINTGEIRISTPNK